MLTNITTSHFKKIHVIHFVKIHRELWNLLEKDKYNKPPKSVSVIFSNPKLTFTWLNTAEQITARHLKHIHDG